MTYWFKNDRKKIVKKKYTPSHHQLEEVFLLFCRLDTLFDLQARLCTKNSIQGMRKRVFTVCYFRHEWTVFWLFIHPETTVHSSTQSRYISETLLVRFQIAFYRSIINFSCHRKDMGKIWLCHKEVFKYYYENLGYRNVK